MVAAFRFPAPIKSGGRNLWLDPELDGYIAFEILRRDRPKLADKLLTWIAAAQEAGERPWTVEIMEAKIAALLSERAQAEGGKSDA